MHYNLAAPSPFGFKQSISIPEDIEIVFVADMFVEDFPYGGAELTTEALIGSSPFKVFKLHSKNVTMDLLQQGHKKFWIFGNFANMDMQLIPAIAANLKYSILEYDYKYCRYRSPEKHASIEGKPCNCQTETHGKWVSAFFFGAKSLWWMSEAQQQHYSNVFPFLREKPATVLSSVFDEATLATVKILREKYKDTPREGWLVLGSTSWIKGTEAAEEWCKANSKAYETVWQIPYAEVLEKMAQCEGFVYLPQGSDTCPRMTIEAKLLGCNLALNDNVQHSKEEWFDTRDMLTLESYLYMARSRFWNGIYADMGEDDVTLSGYTTTYNCITNDYPFIESIMSLVGFCNEVVVVDSGSDDGTWDELQQLAEAHDNIKIYQCRRDREAKRWALNFDGRQKALARSLCTKSFCWQQDSDEIVHEDDYDKIKKLIKHFPKETDLVCLPIIEYWGSAGKVRCDVHNWKWRVSRNKPGLTHGVPRELRQYDEDGNLFSAQGSDSCDSIWLGDYSRVNYMNFYTQDVEDVRQRAIQEEDSQALTDYEDWYNEIINNLPTVHHYSWFNIDRKIKSYRNYWGRFWESMYNIKQEDTAENNMFFDKPWADVTDDDVEEMATRLEDELGGWIFHKKVQFDAKIPHIKCTREHPILMAEWLDRNSFDLVDEDNEGSTPN